MSALDRISVAAIGTSVADLEAETLRAEAAGVECVWAPELFRSAVTQAAYLAAKTERIDVATGIVWAFTRSPFIHAVTALDIDEMSGGRFRLGMGAGVKRLNETWHNADYGKPAPHLREAIEATRLIMRQASAGEPIRYEGEYYDIDIKGWVRPHPAPREAVPIYTAAVQAGMARMAGDVADGLIGHPIQSLRWIDEVVVDAFETGLRRSGRERKDFDYLPTVCCAIDDDEGRAIEMARRTISFYATVKTYMPLWELHGFADNAVAAGRGVPPRRPRRGAGGDQRRDGRDLLRRRPARQGPGPGRGDRRARRRPLPHAADLLHLPRGAERVPEPHHRRLRPGGLTAATPSSRDCEEVLERVRAIPRGSCSTYGDVSPGAPRFAGTVLFEVDEPDLPWWRVVRADGSLAKGDRQRGGSSPRACPSAASASTWQGRGSPLPGARLRGRSTTRWKSASSLAPSLSRVWTSIAFGLAGEMLVWA